MRAILIIAVLAAFVGGGWSAVTYKAPQMEDDVDQRAEEAVLPLATHLVTVKTDGRHIVLAGTANDEDERDRLMEAAEINGHVDVVSRLDVLQRADPFGFTAVRDTEGAYSLTGVVPDAATETALVEKAKILSGGKSVTSDLALAAGAPEGDWQGMAVNSLEALAPLAEGTARVEGTSVSVSGRSIGPEAKEVVDTVIAAAPMGEWRSDIVVEFAKVSPYRFSARKTGDRITFSGNAPDDQVETRFRERVVALAPDTAEGSLELATGMPNADWPLLVEQSLGALALTRNGVLDISDEAVSLTGEVENAEDQARLMAAVDPSWATEIGVLAPEPAQAPLTPEVTFTKSNGDVRFDGVLPSGSDIDAALAELGTTSSDLTTGAEGDGGAWSQGLTGVNTLLGAYDEAEGRLTEGQIEIEGKLAPGQTVEQLGQWAPEFLGSDWNIALGGTEVEAEEGTTRVNLGSGEDEVLARGFWLPQLSFEPSVPACTSKATEALQAEKITFVTGSADIDAKARRILNRLSAVAIRCLGEEGLTLEIAGHTDSVGNDEANRTLSEARAAAVTAALVERGVSAEAMTSLGFGEAAPIADNSTPEGRAQNRRIDFTFK